MNFLSQLTGSFAQPCAENPTVAMVEAAYRHHGLDWRYINCEVPPDQLQAAVSGAKAMGWAGFNCSLPHKVAVIPFLDGLGESAEIIGAVNCVVLRGGQWIGENTDGKGFLKSLLEVTDPRGKKVVLFGAGGAARAVGVELALAGAAEIHVVNRSEDRGNVLSQLLNDKTSTEARLSVLDGDFALPEETDIVINATSIGLYPDTQGRVPVAAESLRASMLTADVVFNPPETTFLREAKAAGCSTLDGLGMLVNQGVTGIKYWTGVDADAAVMRKTLEDIFGASV